MTSRKRILSFIVMIAMIITSFDFHAILAAEEVDALEIRTFNIESIYGGRETDRGIVWDAKSSNAGHRFSFRINYAISGKFELGPGSVEIRVPKQILRDRAGGFADRYEMSIPSKKEVDDGEEISTDVNYAYYEDGDDIVIYNFREVFTGENGYIELSYLTSRSTHSYIDYGADGDSSDPFFATIKVTGNDKEVTEESDKIHVFINTNATIQSTDKRFPTRFEEWQDTWGPKPSDADRYYWLLWEVRTVFNNDTQPYNFTLEDLGLDASDGSVYGVKAQGATSFDIGETSFTRNNQESTGYRYDYVLTRHSKYWWDRQEHVEITNSVKATVDPVDQVDPDTTASSTKTYVWNQPKFIHPMGWYDSFKRADRSYSSNFKLDYLGMKAGEYSRYDLEKFQEGKVDKMTNLDYAVWFEGYPYIHSVENGKDLDDPANYWKVPVRYELTDNIFYLYDEADGIDEPNVGLDDETYGIPKQEYIDDKLTYRDFQIDTLAFGTQGYQDATFSNASKEFKPADVKYQDGDVLTFYAQFGEDTEFIKVATYDIYHDETWFDPEYVKEMNSMMITFRDNCVGYRVETYSAHYHTKVDLVPNIRLKNSERVMHFVNERRPGGSDAIGILNSETTKFYTMNSDGTYEGDYFMTRSESASDYIRKSVRNSHINKKITATANSNRKRQYTIDWQIKMDELYTVGEGSRRSIKQDGGRFYDLLPEGSILLKDSIKVSSDQGTLDANDYSIKETPDYNESGRTLLEVHILEPGSGYTLSYETNHPWDSIKDWGNEIYNPIAYETGNEDISPFNTDGNRGPEKAKTFFDDFVDDPEKFIFAETHFDISILTAAAANLHKKVKDSTDRDYSYDTWTTLDGDYSYRWRYQNTSSTRAKDLVFFDSLENYPEEQRDGSFKQSDWRGTPVSVDVSQLVSKGIAPVVYYSSIEDLDLERNHDLTDASVWKKASDFGDIKNAKAIAVDATRKEDGSDFVLSQGDSLSIVINMKAPHVVSYQGNGYPEAYNNIYLENTTIDENDGQTHFYIHQDYTKIRLRVTGDIKAKKVNAENEEETIRGIKFRLTGTSNYGNKIDEIKTSGRNGSLIFSDVEMGDYILQEYEGTDDWLEDHTEYRVKIDEEGKTWINRTLMQDDPFIIKNSPRIHGDVSIQKRREGTGEARNKLIDDITSSGIGGTIEYKGEDYEVMSIGEEYARLRVRIPEFEYPELEDSGEDIYKMSFKYCDEEQSMGYPIEDRMEYYGEHWDDVLDMRITSGGELIIGKEGETQYLIPAYNNSGYPWKYRNGIPESYLRQVKAIRFVGKVIATGTNSLHRFFDDAGSSYPLQHNTEYLSLENLYLDQSITSIQSFVGGLKNLKALDFGSTIDLSNITYFYQLFRGNTKLEYVDLSDQNIHLLTSMTNAFIDCTGLKIIDLTGLDLTDVDEMSLGSTFYNCSSLEHIYVKDNWDFSKVHKANSFTTFTRCSNLPNWDTTAADMEQASYKHAFVGDNGYLEYYEKIPMTPKAAVPVDNTTFRLSGTSDYGTEYREYEVTDGSGNLKFSNIEKGEYKLVEIKENEDYVLNETVWTVKIDEKGHAQVSEPEDEADRDRLYEVQYKGGSYIVYNEPRYHDFALTKVSSEDLSLTLEGAVFRLKGVSALGTKYDVEASSDKDGRVAFDGIEKGTYVLEETKAPVNVDENGHKGGSNSYIRDTRKYEVTIKGDGSVIIIREGTGVPLVEVTEHAYRFTNDPIEQGEIVITKKWVDYDDSKRVTPKIHLSTEPFVNGETEGTEWITEDDKWEKSGDTWIYRFAVEDDTRKYYVYEEPIEEYTSDASEYIVINDGDITKHGIVTNTTEEGYSSIKISKALKSGTLYSSTDYEHKTKYSHTSNVNDSGEQESDYELKQQYRDVVRIPGAKELKVTLTYNTNYSDYVYVFDGEYAGDITNSISGYRERLSGYRSTRTYTIKGDTVTFGFYSGSSYTGNYRYGYYAVVEADQPAVAGTAEIPEKEHDRRFTFNVKLEGDHISGRQVFGDYVFLDGEAKVTLKDGEELTIPDIPKKTKYIVTEVQEESYTPELENNAGELEYLTGELTIGDQERISHTDNVRDDGTKIANFSKGDHKNEVISIPGAQKLQIELRYGAYSSNDATCIWQGAHTDYTVPANHESSFTGKLFGYRNVGSYSYGPVSKTYLIKGDTITIGFDAVEGYAPSYYSSTRYGYYAVVRDATDTRKWNTVDAEVNAVNSYNTYEQETVDVSLRKEVSGDALPGMKFPFVVSLMGLKPETKYEISNGQTFTSYVDGSAIVDIELEKDEEIKLLGIPKGAQYTVMEKAVSGFISEYEISDRNGGDLVRRNFADNATENRSLITELETADSGEDALVIFTNKSVRSQRLCINKKVIGEDKPGGFSFHIVIDGLRPDTGYDTNLGRMVSDDEGILERDVSLSDGEYLEFLELPVGAGYQVSEEDYSADGYEPDIESSDMNGVDGNKVSGNIPDDSPVDITYKNIEYTWIKGTKTWVDDGRDHDNETEVIIRLIRKTESGEKEEVKDFDIEWEGDEYQIGHLPVANDDDEKYEYSVEEEPVDGYESTVDGFDITNTYEEEEPPDEPPEEEPPEEEEPDKPSDEEESDEPPEKPPVSGNEETEETEETDSPEYAVRKEVNEKKSLKLKKINERFSYKITGSLKGSVESYRIVDRLPDELMLRGKADVGITINGERLEDGERDEILSIKGQKLIIEPEKEQLKEKDEFEIVIDFRVRFSDDVEYDDVKSGVKNVAELFIDGAKVTNETTDSTAYVYPPYEAEPEEPEEEKKEEPEEETEKKIHDVRTGDETGYLIWMFLLLAAAACLLALRKRN